jgi:mono/diheme cytochrome c family protein
MRRTAVVVCLIVLAACGRRGGRSISLRTEALEQVTVTIDITRDTTVTAPQGTQITIPAHALETDGATQVRLVIREALTISDMIRACLLTQSKGEPLSSGGMIDIEPAEGQTVRITGTLSVRLPTPYLAPGMEIYKGVLDADGHLDWTDPKPLSSGDRLAALDSGKQLFTTLCSSCHGIGGEVTAPDLAHVTGRREKVWLYAATRNFNALVQSGDCLAIEEKRLNYNLMTAFPTLTDTQIEELYAYIDNETARRGLPAPKDLAKAHLDSCRVYREKLDSLRLIRAELIKSNGKEIEQTRTLPQGYQSPDTGQGQKVTPLSINSEYYLFTVKSFGWYNVDILLQNVPGVKMSRLFVRFQLQYATEVNLYLVIPNARVLQEGGALSGQGDAFGFYTPDGQTPLQQNVQAVVLAIGEDGGRPLFGMVSFQTTLQQTIRLRITPIDSATLRRRLRALDFKNLGFDLLESRNARALRKNDRDLKDIADLKPKDCDCSCRQEPVETDTLRLR